MARPTRATKQQVSGKSLRGHMMDGDDQYRKLLVTASHAQLERDTELHHGPGQHLPGNVFLPAIQQRNSAQSALSVKHLQIIEQCILAENRREEQLAKCGSERERRYLAKRFIAQRDHERDLVHALMLGRPAEEELEIVDVNVQKTTSPLDRRGKESLRGVRFAPASLDKLITMSGEKTFTTTTASNKKPTKAVSPHFHGIKSPARRREEQARETSLPECKPSPTKLNASPSKVRPTKSASPTSKSPPHSPTFKPAANSPLPHALAHSPFRQAVRQHVRSQRDALHPSPSPSPTKRKKRVVVATHEVEETNCEASPILFCGATSFHEARQQVMAIMRETTGPVDGGTQTTDRSYDLDKGRDQQLVLMLTDDGAPSPPRIAVSKGRPQSSPEPRTRRLSGDTRLLPALVHSSSDTVIPRIEFFLPSNTEDSATFTSDDHTKTIHVLSKDKLPEAIASQLARRREEPTVTQGERWAETAGYTRDEGTEVDWDAQDHLTQQEEDNYYLEPLDGGEDASHVILDVLYDIVHQIEDMPASLFVEKIINLEPRKEKSSIQATKSRHAIRIQSVFRGLRARRAFRLALYQQALESGVLGAMPGTQQGYSGWYQDPKSFMAYYFAVRPDGEWVQNAVLRCSALVLTPYAMREHILSRIQISFEDNEELM